MSKILFNYTALSILSIPNIALKLLGFDNLAFWGSCGPHVFLRLSTMFYYLISIAMQGPYAS